MITQQQLLDGLKEGNYRLIARTLTLVENNLTQADDILKSLQINSEIPIIGITGPPGAGKSTLVNAIADTLVGNGKRIAILAVDPTSPFNFGSLLGDRIRMSGLFNHPNVYIRSIATRGALGGVSVKTLEMIDVLRASNFDAIIVETVGVGQSEVEIAGLADLTLVVLVPESGDEIQHIKSGLMEIAQGFVVNKADREGADNFANKLSKMVSDQHQNIPVFKTIADKNIGIAALCTWLLEKHSVTNERKNLLLTEKAYRIIQYQRMKSVNKKHLATAILKASTDKKFNLYQFVADWV